MKVVKLIAVLALLVSVSPVPARALVGIGCGNRYANCTYACHAHDFMNCANQTNCGNVGNCDTCNIIEEICTETCDIRLELCLQGFPQE